MLEVGGLVLYHLTPAVGLPSLMAPPPSGAPSAWLDDFGEGVSTREKTTVAGDLDVSMLGSRRRGRG